MEIHEWSVKFTTRARPGFVTSMINMTSAEGLSCSRKKRFSEQSAEAQLAAPLHQRRASSSARDARGKRALASNRGRWRLVHGAALRKIA
jgi:hypothetical protein